MNPIRVTTYGSVANLGPGFDILALAVDLPMTITATPTDGDEIVCNLGWDDTLRDPERNLVAQAYRTTVRDLTGTVSGVLLDVDSRIPIARGIGSSAAALVAGILIGAARSGVALGLDDVWRRAAEMEGHGDNVAAVVYGGLTVSAAGMIPQHVEIGTELHAVLFVPEEEGTTERARAVVPDSFSRGDAIFNAGRIALLVRACALGEYTTLPEAMVDRWHQDARTELYPWLTAFIAAGQAAGICGVALSGAGPSVVALTVGELDGVAAALERCARANGVPGTVGICAIRNSGAKVEKLND